MTKAIIVGVVLVVGALVDAGLMLRAIEAVLGDSQTTSSVIAVAIAALAATAAAVAGASVRGARGNHPGQSSALILPVLILLLWVCLGLGIAAIRVVSATITTTTSYDGAVPASGVSRPAIVAAAVFLVVHFVVGLLAYLDGSEMRNDGFSAKVHAQKKLARALKRLAESESLYARLVANLHIRQYELATNDLEAQLAKADNRTEADYEMQLSRLEQGITAGDTAKMGITSAKHPDNPQPAASA